MAPAIVKLATLCLASSRSPARSPSPTPSPSPLVGSSWAVQLNVGREDGTWMTDSWGASGSRLLLDLKLRFNPLPWPDSINEPIIGPPGAARQLSVQSPAFVTVGNTRSEVGGRYHHPRFLQYCSCAPDLPMPCHRANRCGSFRAVGACWSLGPTLLAHKNPCDSGSS